MRRLLTAVLVLGCLSCVDVKDGDTGSYTDPCEGQFSAALLCGRESGGADPLRATPGIGAGQGGEPGGAGCAEACDVLVACFGGATPEEIAMCVAECEAQSTPEQRECIIRQGPSCDFTPCADEGATP